MSFLNNLSSLLRQVPLPVNNASMSAAGMAQAAGLGGGTSSIDNLISHSMGRSAQPSQSELDQEPPLQRKIPSGGSADSLAAPMYRPALSRARVLRAGQQHAKWRNPFVSAAMPAILQLQDQLLHGSVNQPAMRAQLVLELRLFRERMGKSGCDSTQVAEASYLLCTYLDEVVSDAMRLAQQIPYEGDRSLLVEFHDDAWGGEDAFAHLEYAMRLDHPPFELLGLYEMLLALGLQGRYRMLERGDVLRQDLRSQLHAMLWQQQPSALGLELPPPVPPNQRWWTAPRAAFAALLLILLLYALATLDLDSRGRPIRQAISAWEPPTHTIDPIETLAPPLPQLVAEGWLSAFKHPEGWLLVFKSDRAFDVGQAHFRSEFLYNLDRLALAFAPWPGDIEVIGHTDAQPVRSGRFKDNQELSEVRARVVAQRMLESAVPGGPRAPGNTLPRQISSSGRGEREPIDEGKTPAANERNRRVDVLWKVLPKGTTRAKKDSSTMYLPTPESVSAPATATTPRP